MRVRRDDAAERITAQRGDVAPCQILERGLVAKAAGDVAAVQFLRPKDGEVDPGAAQQQDQGPERALGAQVEGAVAQPEQHVAPALVGQHGQAQVHGPVEPAGERAASGIVGRLQLLQHSGGLAGGGSQFQRLEPAEVDHGIDMLDHHRAFLHAGAAGGAGPERVRVDHRADDRLAGAAMGEAERAAGMVVAGVGAVVGAVLQRRHQILDQLLRVERQAGGIGWAGRLAAAALDAGVEPEQAVPVEVEGAFGAELAVGLQVQRKQRRVAAQAVVEALGARMGDQVESAVDGVLQGTFPDAEHQFGAAPGSDQDEGEAEGPGEDSAGGLVQRHHQEGRGVGQQGEGQTAEAALRQFGRLFDPAAPADHQASGQHRRKGKAEQAPDGPVPKRWDRQQRDQRQRCQEAARRQRVEAGVERLALDHVMDIDQIAARQRLQSRDQIDIRRPARPPAPRLDERQRQAGSQRDDYDRGER